MGLHLCGTKSLSVRYTRNGVNPTRVTKALRTIIEAEVGARIQRRYERKCKQLLDRFRAHEYDPRDLHRKKQSIYQSAKALTAYVRADVTIKTLVLMNELFSSEQLTSGTFPSAVAVLVIASGEAR